ncbi:amino acid adenylation domain-containing protein [Nonomuraea sp. NPDC050328]|uniref:amino acid adenylation domain-containing protein n=1 Tax=Nonomuraea sp. NPDC050328 TaxID=3364361 RepID=UPI0037A09759
MTGPLLHELVLAQAERTPDAVAIRQWTRALTFGELAEAATGLAARLREAGAGPETRIGVCARRTPDLLVAVLGVMAAGSAYVPLDPAHPRARLLDVLDDAGLSIVVTDEPGRALLSGPGTGSTDPGLSGMGVDLIGVGERAKRPGDAPPDRPRPDNAAYVLYTSGSTGRPKGVVVEHAAAVAFVTMAGRYFELDAGCRSIGFAALGFDVSVLDIFAPLARGGSVMFIPDEDRTDPARLQRFLEQHEVTWGTIPPALLPLLDPDRLPTLRDVLTAGEPAGPEQVARWARPGTRRFHNWYGPTETTVCVVGTELSGAWDRPLPIGHALPGCIARVLDEHGETCPPGTPGELFIGGPQLARGYLNRPELTAERFVPDPYGPPGSRLYRTGDRVVIEPDGRIGFLGRVDRQVKVQGQRVELGEIEVVLRAHPEIGQAVVDLAPGPGGRPELTAYLAPLSAPGLEQVRAHCQDRLPRYMIPVRVLRLAVLPLTVAGKVDLARLRAESAERLKAEATGPEQAPDRPPRTPVEKAVALAWERVFELGPPGLDTDFYASGGHSLLAMRLVAALRADLRREITVEDVLAGRTVEALARRAEAAPPADEPPARAVPALTPIQRRMWFVERLAPGTPVHNIALAQRLSGPLDLDALRRALAAVHRRHEVLRWSVTDVDGVPQVAVASPGEVPLPVDLAAGGSTDEWLAAEARRPFDLAAGPLWRARLLRVGDREHVLALTAHHIVFDGWSQQVLLDDLSRAYRGEALPELPVDFSGYAAWLDARPSGEALGWWAERLDGVPSVLDLPGDHPRPAVQTFEGAAAHATIPSGDAVRALAARLGATPYAVMLAAFAQVLSRLTGADDLVVGTPVADRRHPAFDPLVGCLVQVLPVRLAVRGSVSFDEQVVGCRQALAEAMAHLDVRLEGVVERLGTGRDLARNPLVQVLFNMYDYTEPRLDLPGVAVEPLPAGLPGSLFDLTLYVGERAGGYELQAVYNPRLYRAERIEALLAGYVRLLDQVVAAPGSPVQEATLRPAGHRLPGGSGLPDGQRELAEWAGDGLVERVHRRAAAHPDRTAVTGVGGTLTYGQLVTLAAATTAAVTTPLGQAASWEAVGVLAARSYELPGLLLGVLAAGARWAVLDPALPPARLAAQAAAAGATALLCCPGTTAPPELAHLPELPVPGPADRAGRGLPAVPLAERGYLAFTSGTTGDPKPVHAAEYPLARFLDWYPRAFQLTEDDRFALLAGLAHDPLLRDAFVPLVLGATLYVPEQECVRDPARLARWLQEHAITVVHLTPQLARLLAAAGLRLPDLRLVVLGGDRLDWADVTRLRTIAPGARLVNGYGTTETPQLQALHELGAQECGTGSVPVGHGVDGAELLVLTPGGVPAAVGELGEVVVRSRRLADGYLDQQLTADRFATDTDHLDKGTHRLTTETDRPATETRRLATEAGHPATQAGGIARYRTGDLGRYDPEGRVVIAHRADGQVKVRGHRVELGEIERVLAEHPEVRAAAAALVEQPGGPVLRGYAVPAGPGTRAADLQRHLRARLPEAAVPAEVILLPALPLTPNGKLDRAALPDPPPRPASAGAEEPAGQTERLIAGIWREVLGRPRIGLDDNFFDIGGHSLATAEVQARLSGPLGREVSIVDLFRFPTVRSLAVHLDGQSTTSGLDRAARRIAASRARTISRRPDQARKRE